MNDEGDETRTAAAAARAAPGRRGRPPPPAQAGCAAAAPAHHRLINSLTPPSPHHPPPVAAANPTARRSSGVSGTPPSGWASALLSCARLRPASAQPAAEAAVQKAKAAAGSRATPCGSREEEKEQSAQLWHPLLGAGHHAADGWSTCAMGGISSGDG